LGTNEESNKNSGKPKVQVY